MMIFGLTTCPASRVLNRSTISTATLIVSKSELYFDLRRTLRPTKAALLPRRTIDRPEPRLSQLVIEIVDLFKTRDAGQIVSPKIIIANDQLTGQSLAAFAEAPGRRLPIVVETIVGKPRAVTNSHTAIQLAGIATLHTSHRMRQKKLSIICMARESSRLVGSRSSGHLVPKSKTFTNKMMTNL